MCNMDTNKVHSHFNLHMLYLGIPLHGHIPFEDEHNYSSYCISTIGLWARWTQGEMNVQICEDKNGFSIFKILSY